VAKLVMFLASGRADALSGRLFSVEQDVESIVDRAEQVLKEEHLVLRARSI
jgi:hypothetical protein